MKKLFAFFVALLVLSVARSQGQYSTGQHLPMTHMSGLLNLAETIPLPGDGYMDHLTVDVNGQRLFISGEAAKSVITVDLRAGKVIHLTEGLPAMPKKPFYLADSNEVWLTLTDSSFNAVFLVWEQVVPFSGGGTAHMTLWPYYNNFPRHAFSGWHLLNVPTDSNGKLMYAWSFYDWLKGIQAKHRDKI